MRPRLSCCGVLHRVEKAEACVESKVPLRTPLPRRQDGAPEVTSDSSFGQPHSLAASPTQPAALGSRCALAILVWPGIYYPNPNPNPTPEL